MSRSEPQNTESEGPPSSTPVFDIEFTNEIWARLDNRQITEGSGEEHLVTIAVEMPKSFVLPEGVMTHRHSIQIEDQTIFVDIYNDCVRIYSGDYFSPDKTQRYKILRMGSLESDQSTFPENAHRKYIELMRTVAVTSFQIPIDDFEQFTLHGLSKYCARLMAACNLILESERCTFHEMAWNFPYELSFHSIGLYLVHIKKPDETHDAKALLGNSGLVALNPPYTNRQKFDEVVTALKPGHQYAVWWQFYCKAATLLGQQSYRSAVLESIIALEIGMTKFVRNRLFSRGVSKSRFNRVKRDLTLSLLLNVELTSLAPEEAKPSDDLIGRLNRARKLRNDIVHEGKSTVPIEEATEAVNAVKDGLLYLSPYIGGKSLDGSSNDDDALHDKLGDRN